MKIMFHTGAYYEEKEGLSYFCSQLLTRGTSIRNAQQIAETVDSIGASLTSSCSWDATSINITSLSDFSKTLTLVLDCFQNPVFSEEEIQRFKTKHISEIDQKLAEPDYLANLALSKALFTGSNFDHSILGLPVNQLMQFKEPIVFNGTKNFCIILKFLLLLPV